MFLKVIPTAIFFSLYLLSQAHSFETKARAAFVLDQTSGAVLFSKNADLPLPPASMSKLMTLYVTFEFIKAGRLGLSEKLPVSKNASSYTGSTMFLNPTDKVTVLDLIKGIIVLSGNDASAVIAEALSPDATEAGFAKLMTQRAKELGLKNSTFKNSNGWPAVGHQMSTRDLGILADRLISDFPKFYPYFSQKTFEFDGRAPANVRNRNPLLHLGIGADGLKTGHSRDSGYGLVGSAKKDGRRIIFVLSGLSSLEERAKEAERLVNWAFGQKVVSSKKSCLDSPINCTKAALCEEASYIIDGKKYWKETARPQHVKLAKQRGLTCGVVGQSKAQASTQTCDDDPKYCGVVQLCTKATILENGKKIWRTDLNGKPYASAAQGIGISCNVDIKPEVEKVYRVANGTGFFVSDDGYVVTNQHVINGCNEVQVHSDGRMAATTIISQDKINDLALLQTKVTPKAKLKFASENPYLLQDIIAAGFPFGESISSTIKVTKGVVSSLSGLGDNSGQIQIDAALQPGNSGGPIIDENGNVVGVAVAKLDLEKSIESFGVVPENVNFGIKLSNLKSFLDGKNVSYEIGRDQKINNSTLGRLATDATVLISCWMTEARIETMQNQKAMFKEILK